MTQHDFPTGFFANDTAPPVGGHTAALKAYFNDLRKIGQLQLGENGFDTIEEAMAAAYQGFVDPAFQAAHWEIMKKAAAKKARR